MCKNEPAIIKVDYNSLLNVYMHDKNMVLAFESFCLFGALEQKLSKINLNNY